MVVERSGYVVFLNEPRRLNGKSISHIFLQRALAQVPSKNRQQQDTSQSARQSQGSFDGEGKFGDFPDQSLLPGCKDSGTCDRDEPTIAAHMKGKIGRAAK